MGVSMLDWILEDRSRHGESGDWTYYVLFAAAAACSTVVAWWVIAELGSPLARYPGPLLARWTNLWRFSVVRGGSYHLKIKSLHEQYGPVIRIGPNTLDLDFPELIKPIYGTDGKWVKTNLYDNNSTMIDGQIIPDMFSTRDETVHAIMKRPVAKHYTSSAVLSVEPLIDKVVGQFCQHLGERFVKGGSACDLGKWIAYCTWDMVGAATFSENFGYMDKGCDHDGTIAIADKALDYFAAVGQMPFLDFLLDKNPVKRIGPPNLGNITRIALEHIDMRAKGTDPNFNPSVPDYLQNFFEAKQSHPDVVHDGMIMNYIFINLAAGADTTALTIRAVIYYLLKHPEVHRKLRGELLAANVGEVAQYSKARNLPYLEAVIRESMRVHPGVAMILERYVPDTGLRLPNGSYVPQDTSVGINPYIVNRNKAVWGSDADEFRPERWLQAKGEGDAVFQERLKLFNATDLAFGGGSRICLGRHLALLETYKIVATLVARYEIQLVDQEGDWVVTNSWFLRQKGLICTLKKNS